MSILLEYPELFLQCSMACPGYQNMDFKIQGVLKYLRMIKQDPRTLNKELR